MWRTKISLVFFMKALMKVWLGHGYVTQTSYPIFVEIFVDTYIVVYIVKVKANDNYRCGE